MLSSDLAIARSATRALPSDAGSSFRIMSRSYHFMFAICSSVSFIHIRSVELKPDRAVQGWLRRF